MLSDRRGTDLGTLLTELRHDLKHLKNELTEQGGEGIDLTALNQAIERTEDKIRAKAEQAVLFSSNEVTTLPPIDSQQTVLAQRRQKKKTTMQHSLTPGQLVKHQHAMQILMSPTHPSHRKVMHDTYGVPKVDNVVTSRRDSQVVSRKAITGSTTSHLAALPSTNRKTSTIPPPVVSQLDAKKGIISLLERGLIPPTTNIHLSPPPFTRQPAQLHPQGSSRLRSSADKRLADNRDTAARWAIVKLDTSSSGQQAVNKPIPPVKRMIEVKPLTLNPLLSRPCSGSPGVQIPPPSTPDLDSYGVHKLTIHGGELLSSAKEFYLFKAENNSNWGPIVTMLKRFEQLCQHYAIPILFLDGYKVALLAAEYELEHSPSKEAMMECVLNRMAVDQLLHQKGRQYKGQQGKYLAATKIQATYRMYRQRTAYIEYRRKQWAAGVIMMSWLMFMKLFNVKEKLKKTRKQHLDNFHNRVQSLRDSWDRINQAKKLIIHLPSKGYPQHVRSTIRDFPTMQALQMARLCDIRDANTDVIYISPVKVTKEVEAYYQQLLDMRPAPHGNYHLLYPENAHKFHKHNLSLSTLMIYSPRTTKRLENLIAGKETYIMTDVISYDDLGLADRLNVPILSPDPDISKLYSSKSGAKRIFASAEVLCPPSVVDVFSADQLVEGLASLVVNNLTVRRWLFKIDDQIHGRGVAYCDVTDHLKCYSWALKERDRFGEKWNKRWAQEYTIQRVISELPDILSSETRFSDPNLYTDWDSFLDAFLFKGGVIEAYPPSDSVTSITANMRITPDGIISLLCTGDHICPEPFRVWGVSLPQCSVEPQLLEEICHRIAKACKARGIIGHFSIKFVTFISPDNGEQQLWATGLDISYGDLTSLYNLLNYITNCKLVQGELLLPVSDECCRRYAVLSNQLYHSNLAVLQYPVFFQICKAHLIGYDADAQQGTIFALVEGGQRESIGMITVNNSLEQAITSYAKNLSVIHQEVSTPSTPGHNNFQSVCKELESISELLLQNQSEIKNNQ
ncbi:IQ domain-containing protein H-like isoform X2 [Dysidea avara]|uniref:IQ domain-containing protein H-like isoform X2 n=1 Tax=Dysidea avara TaxID=196820 RepID=UPI00331BD655